LRPAGHRTGLKSPRINPWPMFRRCLFRLFWNTYDSLGMWLALGCVFLLACVPLVTVPAAWGAMLASAGRAEREQGFDLATFRADFVRYWRRSTLWGLVLAGGLLICAANCYFHVASPAAAALPAALRMGLAGLFMWIAVFVFVGMQVGWAFMTLQDLGIRRALKRGFLVIAAHPFGALTVFLIGAALTISMIFSIIGVILLPALLANLAMGVAGGAIEHHEEREDRILRERLEKEGARSWKDLKSLEQREAARLRRRDRGWRDIFRPWEMR